ncbi:hypothetical protein Afe04nite_54850 [Asanoa ferruginea]|nr:hypothetical protein Afe04nite_54850 [Asanoa ferruginea]
MIMCAGPARHAVGIVDEMQTIKQTGRAVVDQVHTITDCTPHQSTAARGQARSTNDCRRARQDDP